MRPIALLTDFGHDDPYAGQMRGVLARLAPGAPVLDLTHGVAPFQVGQGAFFLAASLPHFPDDTVFACVVDPGVGTGRRIVLAELGAMHLLAPDNGLLGLALHRREARVYDVSAHAEGASSTFHGRDAFAPLAAALARGEPPERLGREMDALSLVRSDACAPTELSEDQAGRMVQAHVLHIDRFGNVVVSLLPGALFERVARLSPPADETPQARRDGERRGPRMVRTYADLDYGELGLLTGSQGFLELAVNQGSAAELLETSLGDVIELGMPD
ncbi:MAG: S-adenosyl-l-methionine hydroxide adenosyltransferase family protein [Desulfovibrionaceae bacterium]